MLIDTCHGKQFKKYETSYIIQSFVGCDGSKQY